MKSATILFCLLFIIISSHNCFSQNSKKITFKVDMNAIVGASIDTVLNVGIRGNVVPLTWVKGIKMKDPNKDGIYSATIEFKGFKQTDLYFKYVLNEVEWEAGDAMKIILKPNSSNTFESTFRYAEIPKNPFKKFTGEWTLKNDNWEQSNDKQEIETIKIPNHYSLCKEVNTKNSLLWVVDATSSRGHIFWTYDASKKEVSHLSSFFPSRVGVGQGTVNHKGDVQLKITFSGEPEGTYRLYSYIWITNDEYDLKSIQYNKDDEPTGSYYGGTFVRIHQ